MKARVMNIILYQFKRAYTPGLAGNHGAIIGEQPLPISDLSILNRIPDRFAIFQAILESISAVNSLVIFACFITLDCG